MKDSKHTLCAMGQFDYFYQNHYASGPFDFSPMVRTVKIVRSFLRRLLSDRSIWDLAAGSYNTDSEAYGLLLAITMNFVEDVLADGKLPVFLIFPESSDVRREVEGKAPSFAPYLLFLEEKQIPFLYPGEALAEHAAPDRLESLFMPGGHYSNVGNRIVAEQVSAYLTVPGFDKSEREKRVQKLRGQFSVDQRNVLHRSSKKFVPGDCDVP